MMKKLELLAPVGAMEHLAAAVENGADAVYLGGKLFNARVNANNFSDEELETAISYAHLRNVKVYVTMNTLLTDDEIEDAIAYAKKLRDIGADAVIVQDLGLAYGIKKYVPGLSLHISTQMSIYNKEGVRAVKKLGAERVVLARELSLKEIKECCQEGIDIEVFGHGALCICYSGQCNMSRLMGGRSGNRGQCAQSCRLQYRGENGEVKHWLSPKDLSVIDYLPQLIAAGVTSLKIEGRMKSPEYVAGVISVYRKYINMAEDVLRLAEKNDQEFLEKHGMVSGYQVALGDKGILTQLFNRGDFTSDYLLGRSGENLMSYDLPKHQGILIGEVVRPVTNKLLEIRLYKGQTLDIGDGIEIHCLGLPGNVVTYIKKKPAAKERNDLTIQAYKNKNVTAKKTKPNAEIIQESFIIGDISGKVKPGAKVYKITDKALMTQIRASYGNATRTRKTVPIDMTVIIKEGAPVKLVISEEYSKLRIEKIFQDIIPEPAINKSLDKDRVQKQLSKLGEYPFHINNFKAILDDGITLPISTLNMIRRESLADFSKEKIIFMRQREEDFTCSTSVQECSSPKAGTSSIQTAYSFEDGSTILKQCANSDSEYINTIYLDCNSYKNIEAAINGLCSALRSGEHIFETEAMEKSRIVIKLPVYNYSNNAERILEKLKKLSSDTGVKITCIPYVYRVSRGRLDSYMRDEISRKKEGETAFSHMCSLGKEEYGSSESEGFASSNITEIMVGNIGWLNELAELGYKAIADYGMNITNCLAKTALKKVYGVDKAVNAMEFKEELYLGRRPLMVMDHKVKSSFLVDRKGKGIDAEYIPEIEKTILSQKGDSLIGDIISTFELLCQGGNGAATQEIVIFV